MKKTRTLLFLSLTSILIFGAFLIQTYLLFKTLRNQEGINTDIEELSEQIAEQPSCKDENTPLSISYCLEFQQYIVQEGDTFFSIAEKFDITADSIRWANMLEERTLLRINQILLIPPIKGIYVTVEEDDTLESIANYFDANPKLILTLNNNISSSSDLEIGMRIFVPISGGKIVS